MRSRPRVAYAAAAAAGLALLLAFALAPAARAGQIGTWAAPESPSTIRLSWSWWEDPANPTGHPEWVGYDLYRRASATCTEWTRLNPDIVPRVPGLSQDLSWLDASPLPATSYQYQVRMVDADRNPVYLLYPACQWPCSPPAFAMCPALSAPAVSGTVTDWGWAVLVLGCTSDCSGGFYVENPAAGALRPYAGTGTIVAVYGQPYCGTVEGCGMTMDHFVTLGPCVSTPTRRATWGALKSHYR